MPCNETRMTTTDLNHADLDLLAEVITPFLQEKGYRWGHFGQVNDPEYVAKARKWLDTAYDGHTLKIPENVDIAGVKVAYSSRVVETTAAKFGWTTTKQGNVYTVVKTSF